MAVSRLRSSVALGISCLTLSALISSTLVGSTELAHPPASGSEETGMRLLEARWEDASTLEPSDRSLSGAAAEEITEVAIAEASTELVEATAALSSAPSASLSGMLADWRLTSALGDTTDALEAAGSTLGAPDLPADQALDAVDAELTEALDRTDQRIDAALADAPDSVVAQLEQAELALDEAVSSLADLDQADGEWITELDGWVPNLRYAIDPRGDRRKIDGSGIDVALIDSGVTPVLGLHGDDKVLNGPDFSPAAGIETAYVDGYGHGTHMASIIAGDDEGVSDLGFAGIAPGSRIVNLKVANAAGETSLESVIAAVEWVIANKNSGDLNIRVITLALGHDESDYRIDPIAGVLEAAWDAGIVVVVAGGNQGTDLGRLDSPALDPYVIAVAAAEQADPMDRSDDTMASWSSVGDNVRNPDVTAPGRSVLGLRTPGSTADQEHPEARIGERFAVASGTSQASAVTAGAVALLLDRDESLSPDEVKGLLMTGARSITRGTTQDGEGMIRLNRSLWYLRTKGTANIPVQNHENTVYHGGFGEGWSGGSWSGGSWSGGSWSGGSWSGGSWSGGSWSGGSWSGGSWSGGSWSGGSWSGGSWSGGSWSGGSWSGGSWSGGSWSGGSWSNGAWN